MLIAPTVATEAVGGVGVQSRKLVHGEVAVDRASESTGSTRLVKATVAVVVDGGANGGPTAGEAEVAEPLPDSSVLLPRPLVP